MHVRFFAASNELTRLIKQHITDVTNLALVGFNPLGQTDTQFIIPLQRNKLNGSSRRAKRS